MSIDEFCEQILKTVTSDRPIELERILKLVREVPQMKHDVETCVRALGEITTKERRISEGKESPSKKDLARISNNSVGNKGNPFGHQRPSWALQPPPYVETMNLRLTKIESTVQEILRKIDVGYIQMEYV